MKRVVLLCLLTGGFGLYQKAFGQMNVFYYYPAQNVYYNTASRQYLFAQNGEWHIGKALPSGTKLDKENRICIGSGTVNILQDSLWHQQIARDWENKNRSGVDTATYVIKVDKDKS